MCGIVGFFNPQGGDETWETTLQNMNICIHHRGPDDQGIWIDLDAGIALGHRRLAIVDLTPTGRQPMVSSSGRYVIIFNGEIYNFLDLRQELEADPNTPPFRGRSDTEVMLAAFEKWGMQASLERFIGMFAFALWDRQERHLFLARDRMGEKPLYYGWMGSTFLFGSELKSFRKHPNWQGEINRDALALYMRHMYVPAPYSIYENIYKLQPGTFLHLADAKRQNTPDPVPYWSLKTVVEAGHREYFQGTDEQEAVHYLEALLKDAIRQQMIADVPLGAFLSGGIDSSTVVALMQAQSSQPIKTFSIGFREQAFNEAPFAKTIANHLGTEHTELHVEPQHALDVIPQLPTIYDEPFADSSQIPTFLLAKMTRQHVTVSLSGDAGDELFAGYDRYFHLLAKNRLMEYIPQWQYKLYNVLPWKVQSELIRACQFIGAKASADWFKYAGKLPGNTAYSPEAFYRLAQLSHWQPESLVLNAKEPPTPMSDPKQWVKIDDLIGRITYFDMAMYLPDDILVRVDRACMAVSLESRIPLLDHRVVEFSQRLPTRMKIRNEQGKWVLRQVLYRYVPQEMVDRDKQGFAIPLDEWLHKDLKEWAGTLLDKTRLQKEGFFNADLVQQHWRDHQRGRRAIGYPLWDVLMFQAWLDYERQ